MLTYIKYLTKQKQGITPQYMNTSKHAVQIIPISILFFVLVLNARELSCQLESSYSDSFHTIEWTNIFDIFKYMETKAILIYLQQQVSECFSVSLA